MKNDFQKLQDDIKKWSDDEFGKYRTGLPMILHMKKEIIELEEELKEFHQGIYSNNDDGYKLVIEKREKILMEYADNLMLLIDSMSHENISINEIYNTMIEKLEINKKRKWSPANDDGFHEHIK